jgi:hypothetical protein
MLPLYQGDLVVRLLGMGGEGACPVVIPVALESAPGNGADALLGCAGDSGDAAMKMSVTVAMRACGRSRVTSLAQRPPRP